MFCPTGTHRYCCRIRESVERRGGYLREEHILAAQYYVTSERQETMLRKDDGLGLSLTPEGPVLRSRGLGLNSVPPQPHTDAYCMESVFPHFSSFQSCCSVGPLHTGCPAFTASRGRPRKAGPERQPPARPLYYDN